MVPPLTANAAQDAQPALIACAVLKNFLRGALLAFFATFLGVFLFFTFPDMVAGTLLRRPMPFWFYENEVRQYLQPASSGDVRLLTGMQHSCDAVLAADASLTGRCSCRPLSSTWARQ